MKVALVASWIIDHEEKCVFSKVIGIEPPKEEKDNLEFFYKAIECDMIDIVYAEGFDMVVDDEGLLKSNNVVNEYTLPNGSKVVLAGNIVFTKPCDNEGRTVWFDEDEDLELIVSIQDMIKASELKGVTKNDTQNKVRRGMQ